MKPCRILLATLTLLVPMSLQAEENVISDDGREVRLNDDGSWSYISNDRFATTASGSRVRLKDNGTWEMTGESALIERAVIGSATVSVAAIAKSPVEVVLGDAVIESVRSKKSVAHKNSRLITRTYFYLTISVGDNAEGAITLPGGDSGFSVSDSDGREYPILSVEPSGSTLKPGTDTTLMVVADGAPHWFTTKFFELRLKTGILNNDKPLLLRRALSDTKKRDVEMFSTYRTPTD